MEQKVVYDQDDQHSSPWSVSTRIKMLLWEYSWFFLCAWTPKPFNRWRLLILKIFGASIHGRPFVHQRAKIQIPWNLTMFNKSCIGDRANIYSLGEVIIKEKATVAQEAYICTGTHDFSRASMNLVTKPIIIEEHAFIGVRALILPGIIIGEYAVIGAGSLVTKNVDKCSIVAGTPAKVIKKREVLC